MIAIRDFKQLVVVPTLEAIGWAGTTAVNLVTGTALVESNLSYLKQFGGGPALSVYQIERATFDDWVQRWLPLHPEALAIVRTFALDGKISFEQIAGNLYLATLACRGKYMTVPAPLPANNSQALADYHKKYYNTALGKADAALNVSVFRAAIAA